MCKDERVLLLVRLKFINLEIKNIITNIMLSNEFTGVAKCILILVFVIPDLYVFELLGGQF